MSPAAAAATACSVARSQAARPCGSSSSSEPSPRSTTASPERKPRCGAPSRGERAEALDHRIPSSCRSATGSKNEQLPTATSCSRRTRASSSARPRGRASGGRAASSSTSLVERGGVLERAGGEHVQEAVPALGRERMVQAGGRLERNARVRQAREEAAERRRPRAPRRRRSAPSRAARAPRAPPTFCLEPVAERQLDVRLARRARRAPPPSASRPPRRAGRPPYGAVEEDRERSVLALELVQPRRRARRAARSIHACSSARARRSSSIASAHGAGSPAEERRVVDQVRERRAAGIQHAPSLEAPQAWRKTIVRLKPPR